MDRRMTSNIQDSKYSAGFIEGSSDEKGSVESYFVQMFGLRADGSLVTVFKTFVFRFFRTSRDRRDRPSQSGPT
jgi:hypothetical protein